ncbi:MAG TPA: ABC-type transport auxiliary lipoprotein family protein [Ramlibacter sp.]|nr:ABC-type transport auxiliary lipoprotein family protein [Ramlibacter sp.]
MSDCGRRPAAAFLLVAVLALPGCALQPVAVQTRQALLTQLPEQVPHAASRGAATLLVFTPRSRPLYDTVRMAYQRQSQEVEYFSRHEWAETPAQMLQPLLVRTLQDVGSFSAVATPPYSGPYDWGLRTEIGELVADFAPDPAVLRLLLRLQLQDGASGRVVATRDVSVREPLRQRTPEACIAAANAATAQALLEVARFAVENAR